MVAYDHVGCRQRRALGVALAHGFSIRIVAEGVLLSRIHACKQRDRGGKRRVTRFSICSYSTAELLTVM